MVTPSSINTTVGIAGIDSTGDDRLSLTELAVLYELQSTAQSVYSTEHKGRGIFLI
jgi:hypothetical protein